MEFKDITEAIEKGWAGWLALIFVLTKDTQIGSKIWGVFVKERERKLAKDDTYEELAIATVKRTLETSAELPEKIKNLEYLLSNQGDMLEELVHSVRALNMESSVNEKKLNEIVTLSNTISKILLELKMAVSTCDLKKGKKA